MRNRVSVSLPEDLAEWLEKSALKAGVSRGSIIREQLEKARARQAMPFLPLAGRIAGDARLSLRKGFAKQ